MCASECGNVRLLWTQFLLVDPDASWQGQIWGHCFECSDFNDVAEFTRECKRRKELRAQAMRGKRKRSRSMTFNNVKDVIAEMLPGASNTERRRLSYLRTKCVAAAFLHNFEKSNPHYQEVCHQINMEYLAALDKAAADPSYACPVTAQSLTSC